MFSAGNSLSASQLLPLWHAAPATAGFPCLRCIMEISKCGLDKSETFFLLVWGKKEQGTFFRFPAHAAPATAGFPCLRCIMEISKCGLDKSETFFLLVWGKKEQGTFFRFPARCAAGRAVSIKF